MIDPKELRIGNWIWSEVSEMELKVEANYFEMLEFDLKQKNSFYSPIPLTPEWLERLGFECVLLTHTKAHYVIEKNMRYMVFHLVDGKWFLQNLGFSIQIDYVHSLQNLVFALTGEEL